MSETFRLTESLTKENFWDELEKEYPKGFKVFTDWIDQYKIAIDWNNLFNGGIYYFTRTNLEDHTEAPKYHELPYAVQLGMWLEFVCDRGGCQFEIEDFFNFNLRDEIVEYTKMLEVEQ